MAHPLCWDFPPVVTHSGLASTASPQVPEAVLASPPMQGLPCGTGGDHGSTAWPSVPWLCPRLCQPPLSAPILVLGCRNEQQNATKELSSAS